MKRADSLIDWAGQFLKYVALMICIKIYQEAFANIKKWKDFSSKRLIFRSVFDS
jgi:hypothetical protein